MSRLSSNRLLEFCAAEEFLTGDGANRENADADAGL
jgi:hypothetical protein